MTGLFHRLWTKAVGTTDYVKSEWMQLEKQMLQAERDRVMLRDVLHALNHVPNHNLPKRELAVGEGTNYVDTYALAAAVQRSLK